MINETDNMIQTMKLAQRLARDFTVADVNRIDRIIDKEIIPALIEEYGSAWEGLPVKVVVARIARCVAVTVNIMRTSPDKAKRQAAALLIARADSDF